MKNVILLLFTCLGVSAATPSFSSFNTNQFSTNNLFISIKDGAVITNLNVITDLFINGTNIVNLFAPSSVTNSGDSLWFDVASAATLTNTMESMVFFHDLLAGDDDSIALDYFVTTDQNFTNYAGLYAPFSSTSSSIQSYTIFGNGGPTEENRVQLSTDATSASIQMLFNGVLTDGFNVATPSGYTGAGTLFLSDDGTYKAAGGVGGDSIWTNITGYVTMIPGQTATNTLAFTSGAADNATNILLKVDSANYLSASGSLLAVFGNAGTNKVRISKLGGITIGPNVEAVTGGSIADDGRAFWALNVTDDGDPADWEIWTGSLQAADYSKGYGTFDALGSTNQSILTMQAKTGAGDAEFRTLVQPSGAGIKSYWSWSGTEQSIIHPTVSPSGSAVAYKFGTSQTLTNGDKFVSVQNAGTEVLNISPNSTGAQIVFGPGATNVLMRAGGANGGSLQYTNASTSYGIHFLDPADNAKAVKYQVTSGGQAEITSTDSYIQLNPTGTANYVMAGTEFHPGATGVNNGNASVPWQDLFVNNNISWNGTTNNLFDTWGIATPEGAETARPGSLFRETATGDLLVKRTGTGNTGWDSVFTIEQGFAASDETTALTTTTNAVRVQLPYNMTLTGVYASLTTVQTAGSTLTIDLKESGTSVLSTLLTIDNDELGSDTAAAPAVISDSTIAKYAPLVFSITQVGTSPAGLKVWIIGRRAP